MALTIDKNRMVNGNTNEMKPGRYLLDKGCPQADIYQVIRRLEDDEDEWETICERRSDDAYVMVVK